uniref:Putative secreted protein ovary overexpressed n=1 Tax=Rhipicephalus microplus TaxID=6941 RepID=A0A6M2DEK8_RHIMP
MNGEKKYSAVQWSRRLGGKMCLLACGLIFLHFCDSTNFCDSTSFFRLGEGGCSSLPFIESLKFCMFIYTCPHMHTRT